MQIVNGPLDLGIWRDRLIEHVPELRAVGLSADLSNAREAIRSTPQAFVVPVADNPATRPGFGASTRSQNVNATVGVVLVVSSQRESSTGGASSSELQTLRSSVMSALIGWQPDGTDTAIQFVGGRLLAFQDSAIFWTDRFSTSYFLRADFET